MYLKYLLTITLFFKGFIGLSQDRNKILEKIGDIVVESNRSDSEYLNGFKVYILDISDFKNDQNFCFSIVTIFNSSDFEEYINTIYYINLDDKYILLKPNDNDKLIAQKLGFTKLPSKLSVSIVQKLFPSVLGGILSHKRSDIFCYKENIIVPLNCYK